MFNWLFSCVGAKMFLVRGQIWPPENDSGESMAAIFKIPNCSLFNTVTISLLHLLPDPWSDVFETCLRCSIGGLVVLAQKWSRSVDKYGRPKMVLLNQHIWPNGGHLIKISNCFKQNAVTILLLHLLPGHWSDVFETCPRCSTGGLVVMARKWFQSVNKCGRGSHLW